MPASASSSQSLPSPSPLLASLSSLSAANTLSELDLHNASISKRQVFAQAIAIAVFYGFTWTLAANVPAAAILFYVIFVPVILNYYLPTQLAAFSFPEHNQSRAFKNSLVLTVLLSMVLLTIVGLSGGDGKQYIIAKGFAIGLFAFKQLFLVREFGANNQEVPPPPPTYLSYFIYPLIMFTTVAWWVSGFSNKLFGLFMTLGMLTLLFTGAFILLGFDKPVDKSKRVCEESGNPLVISKDGYFFSLMYILVEFTGGLSGLLMQGSRESSALAKSIALQIFSTAVVGLAQPVAVRATDRVRFSVLMLSIYVAIDLVQSILYFDAELYSMDFVRIVLVQEFSGLVKNCGLLEFMGYLVRFRKKNPYRSVESVQMMLKKGLIDTMSEILSVVMIICMYVVESFLITSNIARPVIVTKYGLVNGSSSELNVTDVEWEFEWPRCSVTCAGWHAGRGHAPDEVKNAGDLLLLMVVLLVVRVVFMLAERTILLTVQARLSSGDSSVVGIVEEKGEKSEIEEKEGGMADLAVQEASRVFYKASPIFIACILFAGIQGATVGIVQANWSGISDVQTGEVNGIVIDMNVK